MDYDIRAIVDNFMNSINFEGKIEFYSGRLSPELLRKNPDKLYLFGDNLERIGRGGQAIIRGEPNAIGIATKKIPNYKDYFSDEDINIVVDEMKLLLTRFKHKTIVIPVTPGNNTSLGIGLSRLPEKAPQVYLLLNLLCQELKKRYGK